MRNYEIGILPESICISFSPGSETRTMFYYPIWCGHYYCNQDYYIKRKSYPPLLLLYVYAGIFCLDYEGEHYEAGPGQLVFFDCQKPHHYYAKADGLEFSYVHIDGANAHELCQYINHNNGILIDGKNNAQVAREIEEMIELYESGIGESVFAVSSRLYHLMALLDDPIKSTRLRKNDDLVSRTVAYIRANVGKKITLHELAQMAGLSDFYFSHLFKEMTGQSPTEFIIYSRIDQAKVLLTTTSLPVGEIAKQVGYAKSSNFILMFQNRVGCSPLQFRKQQISRQ